MATNIEIKARVDDFEALKARAASLSDQPLAILMQEDTFFHSAKGRLKLRVLAPDRGQLIYYERTNQGGPKRSDYHLAETRDLKISRLLCRWHCVRCVVRKPYLFMAGRHASTWMRSIKVWAELEVVMQKVRGC
jgi:hypothetical protein